MSDISKAYNLSVRDDTTFRVEGGSGADEDKIIVIKNELYDDVLIQDASHNPSMDIVLAANSEANVPITAYNDTIIINSMAH